MTEPHIYSKTQKQKPFPILIQIFSIVEF